MRDSFILSAEQKHHLSMTMARINGGVSIVHPKGRPPAPHVRDFSFVSQQVYPRIPHPLSSHFIDQSP